MADAELVALWGCLATPLYVVIEVDAKREKRFAGSTWKAISDSYWGFGQVTIMVMLLLSVFLVLAKVVSRFASFFSWNAS